MLSKDIKITEKGRDNYVIIMGDPNFDYLNGPCSVIWVGEDTVHAVKHGTLDPILIPSRCIYTIGHLRLWDNNSADTRVYPNSNYLGELIVPLEGFLKKQLGFGCSIFNDNNRGNLSFKTDSYKLESSFAPCDNKYKTIN